MVYRRSLHKKTEMKNMHLKIIQRKWSSFRHKMFNIQFSSLQQLLIYIAQVVENAALMTVVKPKACLQLKLQR